MYKTIITALSLTFNLYGGTINIAVAANVSYAIDSIKKEFNKVYPETKVQVTLGSSGKLTAQIKNGAPYQLFMSANMKYPNKLYADAIAINRPKVYAQGTLAYFSSKPQDFSKGIHLLENQNIKKIAMANPKTAPYGIATLQALKNATIYEKIRSKLIYGESISQTVSYAVTAADMGFIAKSALYSSKMIQYKKGTHWSDLDTKLYEPISQGIVILKNGEASSEVQSFYDFIFSTQAKKIFADFGYTTL